MANLVNNEDLQLISVSYNLGLKNGQQKSGFFSLPFSKPDSTYIEKIVNEITEHTKNNSNSIIALALQEHTGWTKTGFQTRLLKAINSNVDAKKTFTLQEGTNQEKASFRAITKPHNPTSWQGTFIFAPTDVKISDLHHEHYRADHNQGKGGVTSTFTATYSTNSEDTSVKHSIPLTFHGAHLSSDKKDGAYRRNLELMNMVQHFPTGDFLDYDALNAKAHDYSYRFLLGDLNYRNSELRISDSTDPSTPRSSNSQTTSSEQSFSPLKDPNPNIDRFTLDSNGFKTIFPEQACSYLKSSKIRAMTPKRPSQNSSSVKTDELCIHDDTASETSHSSEEQRVETDTGPLDLMVTLGGPASKIEIQEAVYVESKRNPSDHKALVARSSVTRQKTNDFDNVKSMVSSELTNYGTVNETIGEFSGVKQYIENLKENNLNKEHLAALFHLFRSIQDIRLQEQLLELALNPSEKVTQSSSYFSWFYPWTTSQTPPRHVGVDGIKISDKLIQNANDYLNGEKNKGDTISQLIQKMNNTLQNHWEGNKHLSEINTSFSNSMCKMISYFYSCFCSRLFSQSAKIKPEPRETEDKLRKLRITELPSDNTSDLGNLKLCGLFAQPTTTRAENTNTTAEDTKVTYKIPKKESSCSVM